MHFLDSFDFNRQISLYIHIPFCLSKCSYCAFYSKANVCEEEREAYTVKLIQQIEKVTSGMTAPFYTAFIGGGNPFCLSPDQLLRICKAVFKHGRPVEFTTEMNPESASNAYLCLFDEYLTRLSMGVQSLDEKALKFLGRNATIEQTYRGIEWAQKLRARGTDVSFDLITCLDSCFDPLSDIKQMVSSFEPEHLSVYALTLEEGTPLAMQKPNLPDDDRQAEILLKIWDFLTHSGYEHYEVSNFAKNGKISRHNSVYWDYQQYIGLGSGAASTAINGTTYTRFSCAQDFKAFSTSESFDLYKEEVLSKDEAMEELILLGLRHKKGLSLERLEKEFGKKVQFEVPGFKKINEFLVPSEQGFLTADSAALSLIQALS